jgi:hypothetical protein
MPTVAQYSIILDHRVKTPWPDHFSFTLPKSVILSRRSILCFSLKVDAGTMHLKIVMNGKKVETYTLNAWYGTVVKVIPGKKLRHGENTVRFEVTGDSSASSYGGDPFSAKVNNIALWWQKNTNVAD